MVVLFQSLLIPDPCLHMPVLRLTYPYGVQSNGHDSNFFLVVCYCTLSFSTVPQPPLFSSFPRPSNYDQPQFLSSYSYTDDPTNR